MNSGHFSPLVLPSGLYLLSSLFASSVFGKSYALIQLLDERPKLTAKKREALYEEIKHVLPASIELSAYALIISVLVGIPLGFLAALNHHKTTDYVLLSVSVLGYSIPVFWLALLVILVFSLQLGFVVLSNLTYL